jgi:hypothetical protein
MQHQDSYIVVKEFTDNGKKTREVIATGVTKQGFIDAYTEKGFVMRGGENPHFEDIYSGIVYKLEKEFEQGGQIDRERDIQIAKTILMQLGGSNRLQVFTGAYNFVAVPYGVSFRIKNRKVNYVKIVLNAMDTYDVEFGLIRGANYKVVKELNGIYNDQLVEVFTRYTGMALRLRKGGAIQGEENAEMVMNQNLQIRHHTEELEEILKSGKEVPAWVVSKLSRAADSISDATHYLEGTPDKMARGGEVSTQYEAIPNTTYELKIEVYYDKGGMNYFSGGVDKRGYYLSVTPVQIERKENNVMIESYTAFSGVKKLILEVERQSGKSAQKAKELAEYLIPELKQYVLNQMTEKGQIPQANPLPEPEPMPNKGNRIITDLKDFDPKTTEIIDRDANFSQFPNITDLGVLLEIKGYANFENSEVQDLGNLHTIRNYANFRDNQFKNLGNLRAIGGFANFENSQVQDLGNLQTIGGNAKFKNSKVQSLGNLQTIVGDANFRDSQVQDLGNLKTIGGWAFFENSKVQDLGNLQTIEGNIYWGERTDLKAEWEKRKTQLSNEEIWSKIQALEEVLDVLEGADKNMVEIRIKKLYLDLGESKDNNFLDLKIENKKEIIDFVKSNSYFDFEEGEEDENIYFSTRKNGDVGAEIASNIDIGEAKSLKKKVEDKFQDLVVTIEVVDEWVTLTIHKKQVDKYTYRYIFRKGVEGEGFTKGFENIYALIKYAKGFIDFVDWNEIIEKSNKITKYEEPQFTGWYWSSPILLKKAGEEGNKYGYNFYFIKSRGLKEKVNSYAEGGGVSRGKDLFVGDMVKIMPNYVSNYTNAKGQVVKIMPDNRTYQIKIKHKAGNEFVNFDRYDLVFLGNNPKNSNAGGVVEKNEYAEGGLIRNPNKNDFKSKFEWFLENNNNPVSKDNLIKMAYENTTGVDTAIPQNLWGDVDDTYFYVYDYQNSAFGELVDLRMKLKWSNVYVDVTIVKNGEVLYKDDLPYELANPTFHQALNYIWSNADSIEAFDIRPRSEKYAKGGGIGGNTITDLKDFDPNTTEIFDGDADFSEFPSITDLGVLLEIRGDADFDDSQVKSLGNLQTIGSGAYFTDSQVQDLGNLHTIGGDADFRYSQVQSLGNLKTIGGWAFFENSKVQDLGNLQTIEGNAIFRDSQVQDLGNLKTIGGWAFFENGKVQDLGNLQTIGGNIYWGERTDLQAEWERRQQNPKPMFKAEQIRAKIELYEEILEILQGEDRNLVQEKIYILKHTLEEMEDGGEDDNNIKSWYISTYPSDELGEDLNPNAEFSELEENLADIYTYLGVSDSIVRERVFERYSEIFNKPYKYIYDKWVKSDKFAKGGGIGELPPKGELTNKDNFLLKYEKKGGDYEFYIYKPETKKVSGYNQVKHICVNSDCPHKMTYEQFVNYLYAELYLDDMKYANGGEIFVCPVGTEIQTLIFDKSMFNLRQAKAWAKKNNFENAYVDGKLNTLRIRQKDPNLFVEDGFRTIQLRQGVQAVIGCPKRKISRKK